MNCPVPVYSLYASDSDCITSLLLQNVQKSSFNFHSFLAKTDKISKIKIK